MNPAASQFKIRSVITGHGQEGEFIPRNHFVNLNGGPAEFTWQVWTACALNAVYPQGGAWIYDRAGWCPGQASDLKEMEITNMVTPGQIAQVDYGMNGASGASEYIVNNQLVSYGAPNFTLDAALVDVIKPSNKIENSRTGTLCQGPIVRIQNTGSTTLTSAKITYWVNNTSTRETYNWTGFLGYLETADVALPTANVWANMMFANNVFHAEITDPNGSTDGYSYNNKYHSPFNVPTVLSNDFYIWFKSNSAAAETSYQLLDENGTVVASRAGMTNNANYRDTVSLADGCYTFRVIDTDGDGINFGQIMTELVRYNLEVPSTTPLVQSFNGDFGGEDEPCIYRKLSAYLRRNAPDYRSQSVPESCSRQGNGGSEGCRKSSRKIYSNTGQKQSCRTHASRWQNNL